MNNLLIVFAKMIHATNATIRVKNREKKKKKNNEKRAKMETTSGKYFHMTYVLFKIELKMLTITVVMMMIIFISLRNSIRAQNILSSLKRYEYTSKVKSDSMASVSLYKTTKKIITEELERFDCFISRV